MATRRAVTNCSLHFAPVAAAAHLAVSSGCREPVQLALGQCLPGVVEVGGVWSAQIQCLEILIRFQRLIMPISAVRRLISVSE